MDYRQDAGAPMRPSSPHPTDPSHSQLPLRTSLETSPSQELIKGSCVCVELAAVVSSNPTISLFAASLGVEYHSDRSTLGASIEPVCEELASPPLQVTTSDGIDSTETSLSSPEAAYQHAGPLEVRCRNFDAPMNASQEESNQAVNVQVYLKEQHDYSETLPTQESEMSYPPSFSMALSVESKTFNSEFNEARLGTSPSAQSIRLL